MRIDARRRRRVDLQYRLPVAVDDPAASEVVGRQLELDPVAGKDLDAEAAHLARGVAKGLVAVVELHLEHAVREGLEDLALHLDLLFLRAYPITSLRTEVYCGPTRRTANRSDASRGKGKGRR